MRKTFAWKYYKATNDIYYLQKLLNHASPSITYRYIGERPDVDIVLKKMTAEENERSRYLLYKDGNGKKRIQKLKELLDEIEKEMDNPTNNDAYYGRVDCFLTECESLAANFKSINSYRFQTKRHCTDDIFSTVSDLYQIQLKNHLTMPFSALRAEFCKNLMKIMTYNSFFSVL